MNKAILRRAGVALLLTVLVAATVPGASAAPTKPLVLTPGPLIGNYGLERPIVTGAGDQRWATIYGDLVAYEDWAAGDADLKLYNAKTNTTTNVAIRPGSQQWSPRMWGNRIVWTDNRSGNWDVWWYDIAKKQAHRLTSGSGDELWPRIYGDRVVWQDSRNGNNDVYMYDFKTYQTKRITTHIANQESPCISGNRIAWQDFRNGNWDIYWYDLATGQEHQLSSDPANEWDVDISGTKAAWTIVGTANDLRVMAYFDANGGFVLPGPSGANNQDRAQFYNDTLVYNDASSGTPRTNMLRFGVGLGTLTTSAGSKYEPHMWDDTVVWIDNRSGNEDLYAMTIPQPSLSVSAPSTVGFGKLTKVTGYLKGWDGSPLANRLVDVQYVAHTDLYSVMSWTWNHADADLGTAGVQTARTNSVGKFTAYVPAQDARFYVRAWFVGDPDAFMQLSPQKTVLPQVSLSKPTGKSKVSNTKSYTFNGYLKPKHGAGTKRVWFKCYRKSGGKYRYKKTVTATLTDYATYTKYSAKFKLGTEGKWRIRAYYPQTSTNAKSYSSYKYVTSY